MSFFMETAARYERYILENARIVDPSGRTPETDSIVVEGESIRDVCLAAAAREKYPDAVPVDMGGRFVSAGFIDAHVHVHGAIALDADDIGVYSGVTTLLDCGSAGAETFASFLSDVVEKSETEIYALLHISRKGLSVNLQEAVDMADLDVEAAVSVANANPGIIRGMKVRMDRSIIGENGLAPVLRCKKAAGAARLPMMLHIANEPPSLDEMLAVLGKRDVVAHCFNGRTAQIVEAAGTVRPCVLDARARGVFFDVAHGGGSFSIETARAAAKAGFVPDDISSDLHSLSRDKNVFSLAVTMSKFFTLGYSLGEIIDLVTLGPAKVLGLESSHGKIEKGRKADLTVFSVKTGEFVFADSQNMEFQGAKLITPEYAVKAGKVFLCKDTSGGLFNKGKRR